MASIYGVFQAQAVAAAHRPVRPSEPSDTIRLKSGSTLQSSRQIPSLRPLPDNATVGPCDLDDRTASDATFESALNKEQTMHLPHALLPGGHTPPRPAVPIATDWQLPLGLPPTGDLALVRERVRKDALDKWDALTPRSEIRLQNGRVWFPEAAQSDFAASLRPTAWATSQFCQRLGIPAAYFRKCPPRLQDAQFNYWVRQLERQSEGGEEDGCPPFPDRTDDEAPPEGSYPETEPDTPAPSEPWLLRMRGDALRGVLSSRYARLDNDLLLDTLAPLVPPGFAVDWFSLEDAGLHLRLVDPRRPQSVLPGDDLLCGVHIANSEVGKRAVTVDALVYRLVCQNGLIKLVRGKSLMRRRHVSLSHAGFKEALEVAVAEALAEAGCFLEQIRLAALTPVPDVQAVLSLLGRQASLSRGFLEAAERSLRSEPSGQQETVWGLANGLTQAAQGLSPDDRYGIEALAGRLIEHGPPRLPASGSFEGKNHEERKEIGNGERRNGDRAAGPVLGRA